MVAHHSTKKVVETNYPPKTLDDIININTTLSELPNSIEFLRRSSIIDVTRLNLEQLWVSLKPILTSEHWALVIDKALELKICSYYLGVELALAQYYLSVSDTYWEHRLSARLATHRCVQNYIYRYGVCFEKYMNTFAQLMYPNHADRILHHKKKKSDDDSKTTSFVKLITTQPSLFTKFHPSPEWAGSFQNTERVYKNLLRVKEIHWHSKLDRAFLVTNDLNGNNDAAEQIFDTMLLDLQSRYQIFLEGFDNLIADISKKEHAVSH